MEKKSKPMKNKAINALERNNHSSIHDDEMLGLDELFGVQGGVDRDKEQEHVEESCGLGCFGRNIVIKKTNDKQ